MKNIIQVLLVIITTSSFSQHADLYQGDWYVQSVTTSGITTNIPNDPIEFPYVSITFFDSSTGLVGTSNGTPNTMDANYQCGLGFVAHLSYTGTDTFTFQDITLTNTTTDCSSIIINFVNDYVAFFNDLHSENFTYTITDEINNSKTLTIINFNGDTVTYTNQWFTTASEDIANHTWLLNYLEIEGVQQNTPNNEEVSEVPIYFDLNSVGTGVCGGFQSAYDFYLNDSQFYLYNFTVFLSHCGLPSNLDFENDYLGFYIDHLPGPFNYTLTDDNNIATLTITNSIGNSAIYTREVLTTQEHINNSIYIYPNPVKDILTIENNKIPLLKVELFTILGKKTLEVKKNKIDVSALNNGIYLVKIHFKNGTSISKKMIKN